MDKLPDYSKFVYIFIVANAIAGWAIIEGIIWFIKAWYGL